MKMEALQARLEDVKKQIEDIEEEYKEDERRQEGFLSDAQKRQRARRLKPLRETRAAIEKEIADTPRAPREAPERGRAKKEAGKQRRLDAEFADRATGPGDGRGDQIDDVMNRAYEGKGRSIAGPQLYREVKALWEREERP